MTIPGIIVDYKIKQTISKLKKVQTTFSNAVLMAVNEYGPIDTWGLVKDDKESAQILGIRLKPYLKILDDCGTGNCENYTGQWHLLNGIFQSNVTDYKLDFYYKLRLADGAEVFLRPTNTIHVDINGNKTPNVMGKDIFRFYISDNGKVNLTGVGENPNSAGWRQCNPKTGEGWNCAAWVMFKENMDYLKCADELEWDGKTSCK